MTLRDFVRRKLTPTMPSWFPGRGILLRLEARLDLVQRALGRIERNQQRDRHIEDLREAEFQVYSQWGEDGILQFLTGCIPIERPVFVEFGVQTYEQSNTRFLLVESGWSGLVIDGDPKNIACIRADPIYWRHNLKAECAFIDVDNINILIQKHGITGDIGLLSVDIDGNDYWVWQAIRCIQPRIVVCEYNSVFGPDRAVTVPYDPSFVRSEAHHSFLYYGASIAALESLGQQLGYRLVGSNSAGNNAFFLRNDMPGPEAVSGSDAWIESGFRESRDTTGKLNHLVGRDRLRAVEHLPVVDVETGAVQPFRELRGRESAS